MTNSKRLKTSLVAILVLFLIASLIIAVLAIKKALIDDYYVSSELELITEYEDGLEINRYVDANGVTSFAYDKGYAVLTRQRDDENRTVLERYYDENGDPVERAAGYYVLAYSYSDVENSRTTYYMDENLNPVTVNSGYSISVRTYLSDETKDYREMYFDSDMNPICNSSECYGIVYLYEGDLISEYYWVDVDGNPMDSKDGVCRTVRTYDENNKVRTERYYDADDNPVRRTNGEYGIAITYNEAGKRDTVTSLNSNGDPFINDAGYAVIVYTYNRYGRVATERYFDLDGNPCLTGKGWYGKRLDGDRIYYLDSNGRDLINVDSILGNFPFMVSVLGLLVCVAFIFAPRKFDVALLAAYVVFIIYETILYRHSHEPTANLEIFWSYKQFFINEGQRIEIINNIWLFVPYSLGLLSVLKNKKVIIPFLFLPLAIEIVQYVFGIGLFELDDLVSNGLGELIGISLWYVTRNIHIKRDFSNIV